MSKKTVYTWSLLNTSTFNQLRDCLKQQAEIKFPLSIIYNIIQCHLPQEWSLEL